MALFWRQGRQTRRDHRIAGLIGVVALLALGLSLMLAGCGYSGTAPGPGGDGGSSSGPIKGTGVRPCVGPYADIGVEGQPALTLSDTSAEKTGSAHRGDLVQIQLPGSWHWTLGGAPTNLAATAYAGAYDQTRQLCFWNFKATTAGRATLQFTGTPICENGQPCPALARVETFTVEVS